MLLGLTLAVVALAYVLYPLLKAGPRGAEHSAAVDPAVSTCRFCGARPESDAVFCSRCGRALGSG
jgi:hypothetical protein